MRTDVLRQVATVDPANVVDLVRVWFEIAYRFADEDMVQFFLGQPGVDVRRAVPKGKDGP